MLLINSQVQQFALNARRAANMVNRDMASRYRGMLSGAAAVGNALTMPREVWEEWDRELIRVTREELVLFDDLAAAVSRPMNIGKLITYYGTVGDSGDINISLDGRSKAKRDRPEVDYHGTPLPIIDSTYGFGWREMKAMETEGESLEPVARENSNRRVAEKLESIAKVGDASIVVNGNTLTGVMNDPNRMTRTTGIVLQTASGAEVLAEFVAFTRVFHDVNIRRGLTVYVDWDDWFVLSYKEFKNEASTTMAQKIQAIEGIERIVPIPNLGANTMVGVIRQRRYIEVLNGMAPVTVPIARHNVHDDYNFMVMASAAVQVKRDHDGNSGLLVSTPA